MKELVATFIEDGLRGAKGPRAQAPPTRSPLPAARPATGVTIPALSSAQIAKILDAEDAHAGH